MDLRKALARQLLGSGQIGQQADNMQLDPLYQEHVMESRNNGMDPMPRSQWVQQYMQQQKGPQTISGLVQQPGMMKSGY